MHACVRNKIGHVDGKSDRFLDTLIRSPTRARDRRFVVMNAKKVRVNFVSFNSTRCRRARAVERARHDADDGGCFEKMMRIALFPQPTVDRLRVDRDARDDDVPAATTRMR